MTGGYTAEVLLISINEKWLQTRWATSRQIKSHHHGLNNVTSTVIKLEAKRYAHMYTMERPVRKLMASLQGSSLEKSDESNYKDRIFNREPCPQERKTICTNRRQLKVFSFPPTGKYGISSQLSWQGRIWVIKLLQLVFSRSHWQAKLHRTTYNVQTHC